MAEIIILNRARKNKTRAEKRKIAEQNAQKFGHTKSEKKRDDLIAAKAKDHVDQHKLDT